MQVSTAINNYYLVAVVCLAVDKFTSKMSYPLQLDLHLRDVFKLCIKHYR